MIVALRLHLQVVRYEYAELWSTAAKETLKFLNRDLAAVYITLNPYH